jgi:ubiquinone/menaquinone biosynthesis C-methylase UbiE
MKLFGDSLSYSLLKALSHNRNRQTDTQIANSRQQEIYNPFKPNIYLGHINRYINYKDKQLIEIGCGAGDFAISLAKSGARKVVGIDIDQELIGAAQRKAISECVDKKTSFISTDFNNYISNELFDIAFSMNAFEHILSPLTSLKQIYNRITPGGAFCTIFGPLWLSPYGAHMWGFTSVPWVHFLFPESVVLKVRTEYFRPDDPVDKYEDVRGHLNRMTVKKFVNYAKEAGFEVEALRLNPAQDKGKYKLANAIINKVSPLRELCAFQLLAVLKKP